MLAVQVKSTVCGLGANPRPDKETVFGDPVASLTTVTVPLALPAAAGLKFNVIEVLCAGDNTIGVAAPASANAAPFSLIWEIVTFELPVLVNTTACDEVLPTATLPKSKLAWLTDKVLTGATPVPLRLSMFDEFAPLLSSLRIPVTAWADGGVNKTLKLVPCPAASVKGTVRPLMLKPLPLIVT